MEQTASSEQRSQKKERTSLSARVRERITVVIASVLAVAFIAAYVYVWFFACPENHPECSASKEPAATKPRG